MKTGEVEQVLLKLKDPMAASEPKEIERTPCPMCDRSFKVTILISESAAITGDRRSVSGACAHEDIF